MATPCGRELNAERSPHDREVTPGRLGSGRRTLACRAFVAVTPGAPGQRYCSWATTKTRTRATPGASAAGERCSVVTGARSSFSATFSPRNAAAARRRSGTFFPSCGEGLLFSARRERRTV